MLTNMHAQMDSIATASPATVSRCGMVYMAAPHYKLWHHMIRAWCAQLPATLTEYAHKLEVTVNMVGGAVSVWGPATGQQGGQHRVSRVRGTGSAGWVAQV